MAFLQTAITFILVFGALVFFHELGHFLCAKMFGMKVEEFAIGFGNPKLRLFHDGETEYTIRAFPLGGFVRIKGMEIEDAAERRLTGADSHDSGMETTNASTLSQEAAEVSGAEEDGFNSRPIYQRFVVIAGGPAFSFLLGWIALCLIGIIVGRLTVTPQIGVVVPGKPAAVAGIHSGDTILSINNKPINNGDEMIDILRSSPGKELSIALRDDKGGTRSVKVTPDTVKDSSGTIGQIGIQPRIHAEKIGVAESFQQGTGMVGVWFKMLGVVFSNVNTAKESVGGPVKMIAATHEAAKGGVGSVIALLGQLSLSLGLFNLLPIPVLDGGHIALMALEAVRRRKLTADQTNKVFIVGFGIVITFAVVVMFKDVLGLITR